MPEHDPHNLEPADSTASERPSSPEARPEVAYEKTDVRFRGVLIVAIIGCCALTGVFFMVRAFYWSQLERHAARPGGAFPATESPTAELPPEPRLEQLDRLAKTPASDVAKWEQGTSKSLESYGPSEEKGFVNIPLQQAMQLVAKQLPVRKQPDAKVSKDNGLIDAGESNSGRMFRRPPQ